MSFMIPTKKWSSDPSAYPDRYGPTNELVRKLIELLGIKYKVPKYTIDIISHLASGPSDMVIVLDKPSFPSSHDLLTPQEFCWASLPLQHLYMLNPFASDSERNIHEVTILREHPYGSVAPDSECHDMRRAILSLKSPKLVVGNSFIMFDPGRLGIWELDEKPSVVSARRRIAAVAKRNELDKAEMSFMSSMVDALSLFSKDSAVFKDIKSPSLEPVGTYEAHWDLLQGTRLLSEILLENHRWKSIKTTDLSKYYPHSVRDQAFIIYTIMPNGMLDHVPQPRSVQEVQALLDELRRPRHSHPSGTYEWTALHLAIYHGHLGSAVKLMEAGATFWVSPSRSPSFLVPTSTEDIQDGYYHHQGAALRAGPNPSHFSKSTALLSAAAAGNPSMVSAVLDRFDVFANNQSKHTTLFNAYIHRSLDAFGLLLRRGANVESPEQPSNTILTFACASDNFTDASWLIKLGADVTRTNVRGLTPLNCLCSKLDRLMRTPNQDAGDLVKLRDTMEILLTTGADPNACVPSTLLPLAVAAIWCQIDIIKLLLDHNADINAQDTIGETALMTLCLTIPDRPAHKLIATAKFLLDQGALPGATASSETKLLVNIVNIQTWHDQDIATLLELVAMRKLADETKSYMVNLLGLSFVRHRLQCCQVLAKYAGRCPNIGENKEMLDFAINDDYIEGLKFLLSLQGMNEIVRNPSRLYQACERGATKVADLLLRSGVPCTFVADGGWSCLHRACQKARDDLRVPELLLKQGCDPNHETDDSETPLLLAIKLRHDGLVKLLLDHGANPNHICEDGVHPMDLAHQLDYFEILGLLLRRNELDGAERAFWVRTLREERRNQGRQ
ncbi:Ankyrin-2 [Neopestalotiopsis sp. 37M]|nr:Ankyrin-2 [Neopestalotiopsis sp. 37M]